MHLRREQGSLAPLERQSGFEIEPTPPVQLPRESGNRQFRVRVRADHGLRYTPAGEAALGHRTGYGESLLN